MWGKGPYGDLIQRLLGLHCSEAGLKLGNLDLGRLDKLGGLSERRFLRRCDEGTVPGDGRER